MKLIHVQPDPPALQLPEVLPEGRQGVLVVEAAIKQLPQIDLPLEHILVPGVYARTMFIPAGVVLAGKIHKHQHLNIVLKGEIEVLTADGVRRICGPKLFVSEPGTKRAGYAYADTVWTTIHHNPDDLKDIDELEKLIAVDSFEEFEQYINGDVI